MSAKINETTNDLSSSPTQDLSENSRHKFLNKLDLRLSKRPNRLVKNKVVVWYKSKSLRKYKKDFNLTGLQVSPEVCTKCHEYIDPASKVPSNPCKSIDKRRGSKIPNLRPYRMILSPNFRVESSSVRHKSRNIPVRSFTQSSTKKRSERSP